MNHATHSVLTIRIAADAGQPFSDIDNDRDLPSFVMDYCPAMGDDFGAYRFALRLDVATHAGDVFAPIVCRAALIGWHRDDKTKTVVLDRPFNQSDRAEIARLYAAEIAELDSNRIIS